MEGNRDAEVNGYVLEREPVRCNAFAASLLGNDIGIKFVYLADELEVEAKIFDKCRIPFTTRISRVVAPQVNSDRQEYRVELDIEG